VAVTPDGTLPAKTALFAGRQIGCRAQLPLKAPQAISANKISDEA